MDIKPARIAAAFVVMLTVAVAGLPAARAQSTTTNSVDPVISDVVRMLDVGVEPDLIVEWVKSSGRQPRPLTADDVIALSQANAPRDLIQTLLDLSARPAPTPAAPATRPTAPPTQGPGAAPVPAVPSGTGLATDEECCSLEVSVEYRANEGYEGDRTAVPARDLYLYVDGEFLMRVTSVGELLPKGPTRVMTKLPLGTHTVRLTRELHVENKDLLKKPGWDHVTTVSPVVLTLPMDQAANYNLDIRWVEPQFTSKPPMSWRWSRDGKKLASEKRVGESKSKWPYLCNDVETSLAEGAIAEWRAKDRMKGCVTWSSLWPEVVKTTREEVLEYLARYDYDPPAGYIGSTDWGR